MSYAICETGGETGGEGDRLGDVAMRCDAMRNECIMRIDNGRRPVVDSRARRPRNSPIQSSKRALRVTMRRDSQQLDDTPRHRHHVRPRPRPRSPRRTRRPLLPHPHTHTLLARLPLHPPHPLPLSSVPSTRRRGTTPPTPPTPRAVARPWTFPLLLPVSISLFEKQAFSLPVERTRAQVTRSKRVLMRRRLWMRRRERHPSQTRSWRR